MNIMGFKDRVTRMVQFSDSIIIASLDDSKSALNKIVKAGVVLMQNALETGFALKGAIGRSIVDAYLLEEELKFIFNQEEVLTTDYITSLPRSYQRVTILQHWKSILNFLAEQSLVVLKYILRILWIINIDRLL